MGVMTIRAALAFAAVTLSAGCSVTVSAGYATRRPSTPTPPRYATANTGMLKGLAIFASGLDERNKGLAGHSAAEYTAGDSLIARGLAVQRRAIAEYPAGAHITL